MLSTLIAVTGNWMGKQKLKRIKIIEQIILMLKTIKSQIVYAKLSVPKIFKYLSSCDELYLLDFITITNDYLEKGVEFNDAWLKALNSYIKSHPVKQEDINTLKSFTSGLGNTDIDGQKSNCDTYIELFSLKLDKLKNDAESSVKVCNSLGMVAAALVFIILY